MYENYNFLRETIVDINAAIVGISANRWIGIEEKSTEEEARQLMQKYRFDILPIKSEKAVKSYFYTIERNNYTKIEKASITHRDVIPLQTHIRDVIKTFHKEERTFFFLLDENKISGLISELNLNCRQVKVWLFGLLSELEVKLGELTANHFSDEEKLKRKVFAKSDKNSRDCKNRYEKDLQKGTESNFIEYLYLSTLIDIIREDNIYGKIGYRDANIFVNDFKRIKSLRNAVMHSSSIITKEKSVKDLWSIIDKIEESLFLLR